MTAQNTKLTLINFEGRTAFVRLPVDADGQVRITAADAARICGVPERTPEQLRAGCLPVGEGGWTALNCNFHHNRIPAVHVGGRR